MVFTKSKNGLGGLLGILVTAALVFILLNLFGLFTFQFGKFGCGIEPNYRFGAIAEAAEECPKALRGAMHDAEWAADRYATIASAKKTAGLFYDDDGFEHHFRSGDEKGADTERAREYLREVGAAMDRTGEFPAASHVEVKVAALMRESGIQTGVLIINRTGPPCEGAAGFSCQEVLPRLLPAGYKLRVWFKSGNAMDHRDFP